MFSLKCCEKRSRGKIFIRRKNVAKKGPGSVAKRGTIVVDTVSRERNTVDTVVVIQLNIIVCVTGLKFKAKCNSNKDLAGLCEERVIIFRVEIL